MTTLCPSLRASLLAAATAVIPTTLPAQQLDPIVLPWPAAFAGQSTDAVVAGDFKTTLQRDLLVARGGRLYTVLDPALLVSFGEVRTPLNIVDGLAALNAQGPDAFLVSGDLGLYMGTHSPSTGYAFQQLSPSLVRLAELRVRVGTAGRHQILGRTQSDHIVSTSLNLGTGQLTNTQSFATPPLQTILDVEWTDWDGDGVTEIALLADDGLRITNRTGTVLHHLPMNCVDGDLVACFDRTGVVAEERLAILAFDGSTWRLSARNSTANDPAVPLDLSGLPLGIATPSLQTGDLDNDGDGDLHITQSASHHGLVIENQASQGGWFPGPSVSVFAYDIGDGSGDPSLNQVPAVVADMDFDGTADIAQCADAIDSVVVNRVIAEVSGLVLVLAKTEVEPIDYTTVYNGNEEEDWTISITCDPTTEHAATMLEVYEQPDPNAPGAGEPTLLADPFVKMQLWQAAQSTGEPFAFEVNVQSLVESDTLGTWSNGQHLWLVMRTKGINGAVVRQVIAIRMAAFSVPTTELPPLGIYLESKIDPDNSTVDPLPIRPHFAGGAVNYPAGPPPFELF